MTLKSATTALRRRALGHVRRDARILLERLKGGERPLPDAIVIGAQKAGTTALFDQLACHPAVNPSIFKEVHFFDSDYGKGLRWYRRNFPPVDADTRVTIEASPYYLFHPLVPRRLHQALPEARLIAILRDPVARALSHYNHARRRGFERIGTFAEAVAAEEQRLAGAEEALRAGHAEHHGHKHHSYLARGFYHRQLTVWAELFGKERLKVLTLDDLARDPDAAMAEVERFLGLQPFGAYPSLRSNPGRYEPVDPELARRLRALYDEDLGKLRRDFAVGHGW